MHTSHKVVIESLGDTGKVAKHLKVPLSTASAWKTRNAIPAARWWDIVQMAAERGVEGVTVDALAQMAGNRERKDSAA